MKFTAKRDLTLVQKNKEKNWWGIENFLSKHALNAVWSAGVNMPRGDYVQKHGIFRLLIELALRNKNQRVAVDKPNASVPTFVVAGQPVTLEPGFRQVADLRSREFRSMAESLKLLAGLISNLVCGIYAKYPKVRHVPGIARYSAHAQ